MVYKAVERGTKDCFVAIKEVARIKSTTKLRDVLREIAILKHLTAQSPGQCHVVQLIEVLAPPNLENTLRQNYN